MRYALAAPLLCVRRDDGCWDPPPGVTFADWIGGALPGPPTTDDLDYHLSTLFPPVRPRGYLEVRYLDAQPGGDWIVPVAVLAALLGRPATTAEAALQAAAPVAGRWPQAARRGLADPALRRGRRGRGSTWPCRRLDRTGLPAAVRTHVSETVHRRLRGDRPSREEQSMTHETDRLRDRVAAELGRARDRTALLTEAVDDGDLVRQHSPLMSPLVWDLAHVGNQEELWLVRDVGGREPVRRDIDELYDAFKHPRGDRPALPLLGPAEARALRGDGPRQGARRARPRPAGRPPAGRPTGSRSA